MKEVATMSVEVSRRRAVEDGLRRSLSGVRPAAEAEAGWVFASPGGGLPRGRACLEEDWLVLSVAVAPRSWIRDSFRQDGPWSLAVRNGELDGGSKLRVVDDAPTLHLRNEIWIGDGRRAAAAVEDGCRLFREGASSVTGRRGGRESGDAAAASGARVEDLACLKDLAAAGPWSLQERGGGDLVTHLDLGARGAYQLRLQLEPCGDLRAWCAVLPPQELEPGCRRALGLLLARANDRLRLVRGAVHEEQARASVRFEVVQSLPEDAERFELVLSALTTACWKCGPEIRLLAEPDVARRYLESFGVARW